MLPENPPRAFNTRAVHPDGIELWNLGLQHVHPEAIALAIAKYNVDVNMPMQGVDDHPLVSLLYMHDSLYNPGIPCSSFEESQIDFRRRFDLFKVLDMILIKGPDLLSKKDGMTVAEQVIGSHNTNAVAKIILCTIKQGIERDRFMAAIGRGRGAPEAYRLNTAAIFEDKGVSPDFPRRETDIVEAMERAHDCVRRWLLKSGSVVEKDLMENHRDKLGYWLQPFVRPESGHASVIQETPRRAP